MLQNFIVRQNALQYLLTTFYRVSSNSTESNFVFHPSVVDNIKKTNQVFLIQISIFIILLENLNELAIPVEIPRRNSAYWKTKY